MGRKGRFLRNSFSPRPKELIRRNGVAVTMLPMNPKKKEEPIYEKLDPNSCMIISKTDDDVLVACNKKGKVELQRVPIPKKQKA